MSSTHPIIPICGARSTRHIAPPNSVVYRVIARGTSPPQFLARSELGLGSVLTPFEAGSDHFCREAFARQVARTAQAELGFQMEVIRRPAMHSDEPATEVME